MVEYAAAQGMIGHLEDVESRAEDGDEGEYGHGNEHEGVQGGAGYDTRPHEDHEQGADAGERACKDEALPLAAEFLLLFLVRAHLARVANGVSQAAQGGLQLLGPDARGVIADEGLLVGQADVYLEHAVHAAVRAVDGASAEGAGHAADFQVKPCRPSLRHIHVTCSSTQCSGLS